MDFKGVILSEIRQAHKKSVFVLSRRLEKSPFFFTVVQNLRWHFCALRLRYRTFLAPEFRPNLIIVSLHGGHGHTQLPCKIAFIAHAGIFTQVFGQLFFLGADPRLGTPLLYQI